MVLGLAHSLSRCKLNFSPDKADAMIAQAIASLDDLDKEINAHAMRLREWHSWHFPELSKKVAENATYAAVAAKMGMRSEAKNLTFGEMLSEDVEENLKAKMAHAQRRGKQGRNELCASL